MGCSTTSGYISACSAAAIAKQEMMRHGWTEAEVARVQFYKGKWWILVERVPFTFGGDAVVVLERNGSIVRVMRGK